MKTDSWRFAGSRFNRMTKAALASLVLGVILMPIVVYYLTLALLQAAVNIVWFAAKFIEVNWRE